MLADLAVPHGSFYLQHVATESPSGHTLILLNKEKLSNRVPDIENDQLITARRSFGIGLFNQS